MDLYILLAIGTGFSFYWIMRHASQLRVSWWMAALLAIGHTIVGLACVKVFAVLETLDLSKIENQSLFGAVFFMPLAYYLGAKISKRRMSDVFDIFTPCMVFTLLCARTSCILSGCCLGRFIHGASGWRWPTRELEILFYLILLIFYIRKDKQEKNVGLNYPIYMIAYGAFRFLIEGFRTADTVSFVHVSHIWAAITFCLGLSIYIELKQRKTRRK